MRTRPGLGRLVMAVAADGSVAATYVTPNTSQARCLGRRARAAELPAPPSAPFFVGASSIRDD